MHNFYRESLGYCQELTVNVVGTVLIVEDPAKESSLLLKWGGILKHLGKICSRWFRHLQ